MIDMTMMNLMIRLTIREAAFGEIYSAMWEFLTARYAKGSSTNWGQW